MTPIAVSPDGQQVIRASGSKGEMSLTIERIGHTPTRLLHGNHTDISSVFVMRDNRQILFTTIGPNGATVRSVGMDGSGEAELAAFPEYSAIAITDSSPDGKTLAAFVWTKGPPQIALLSIPDRTARLLYRTAEWELAGRIVLFSPDGRQIVACRRMERMSGTWEGRRRQIFRIDVKTGDAAPLVDGPGDVYPIGWSLDGSGLVFARDRFDDVDLLSQPVAEGKAVGSATLVRAGIGRLSPISLIRAGSFFYYLTPLNADIYLADLDLDRGTLTNARPATTSSRGNNRMPLWSPDGKYLVFSSRLREGNVNHLFNRLSVVRPPGEAHNLPALSDTEGGFTSWMKDGTLLVIGARAGQLQMYRLAPPTWTPILAGLLEGREHDLGYPFFGPDRTMYYRRDNPQTIMARTLDTGKERIILPLPEKTYARSMRLSPDGRQLAFILVDEVSSNGKYQAIMTVGTDGQNLRELYRAEAPERLQASTGHGLAWSHDSRSVLFTKGKNAEYDLFYLPASGGKARQVKVDVRGESKIRATYHWMDVSPDGKTLAFGHGEDQRPELWVVEKLLGPIGH